MEAITDKKKIKMWFSIKGICFLQEHRQIFFTVASRDYCLLASVCILERAYLFVSTEKIAPYNKVLFSNVNILLLLFLDSCLFPNER